MTRASAIHRLLAIALWVVPAGASPPPATAAAGEPQDGFVVWESNRSGAFRIWRQELSGSAARQVSPEEPGRDHCCAKLSPSGHRLVYLSLPGGRQSYAREVGALHLMDSDGGRDRVIAAAARHYGEHRAAVWWGLDELVYLDGGGSTVRRWLSTGKEERLALPGPTGEGWLIAPGSRYATGNTPTFSDWDAQHGVTERASLGGCQPTFSGDGKRAVWSAGAGGPIDAIDLATRESWTVLGKNDPRVPADRGYLYFPMLSADSTLLAVAGSNGGHDHFRADYDVLVIALDPRTLEVTSAARRIAPHPAVDRFPDPFRAAASPQLTLARPQEAASDPSRGAREESNGRVLLWERAEAENRAASDDPGTIFRPRGVAWFDRLGAMALAGGRFEADVAVGERLAGALVSTHQLTLALLLAPATLEQEGVLIAFSSAERKRNFLVRQRAGALELVLRTSDTPREGAVARLATLDSDMPLHLALTFSPGRLSAFVNGRQVGATQAFPGDFFHWRPAMLSVGAEAAVASGFRGTLSHLAIWDRPLEPALLAAESERAHAAHAADPVDRIVVEVRVLRISATPSLASISPYREALAVDEVEIVRTVSGAAPRMKMIRRVRWAILDGSPIPAPKPGETRILSLEPFAAQPQLQSFYLANTIGANASPLWFDLGGSASR